MGAGRCQIQSRMAHGQAAPSSRRYASSAFTQTATDSIAPSAEQAFSPMVVKNISAEIFVADAASVLTSVFWASPSHASPS